MNDKRIEEAKKLLLASPQSKAARQAIAALPPEEREVIETSLSEALEAVAQEIQRQLGGE